jgi:sulfide:quinone oxidoreductase
MKNLLILGAGTAGTIMASHLRKKLPKSDWTITMVDRASHHDYQPGYLFMPFGTYSEDDVRRPMKRTVPRGIDFREADVDRIDAEANRVLLQDGTALPYDILIIATGVRPAPDQVEGMVNGDWRKNVHEFYTFEGAQALTERLKSWHGGKLVVHICEMPIKCPVAPLEFCFLADTWLQKQGLREKTEIIYVTPMSGAFTKPVASGILSKLLDEKRISVVHDFAIARVDAEKKAIVSWDEKEVPYDLLVSVPPNMGAEMIERSGLGDELNYVPTDKHTLQSKAHANIFVIGDATDCPTSKAGSVAHFEAEVLTENILHFIAGEPLRSRFDGHANCFIESGHGKAFLLDFNYDQEPVTGTFPFPAVGPMKLLGESRLNHLGKMAFKWIYWNVLLPGLPIPFIGHQMSRLGKNIPPKEAKAAA